MSGVFRLTLSAILAALLALAACPASAQLLMQSDAPRSDMVEKVGGGEIDWGERCYFASGAGVMPSADEESNRSKAYLKAKGYAKMKATANIRMLIEATAVSFRMIGADCISRDDGLKQTIEGYVASVEIVAEKQRTEGGATIVEVTVRAPMYGPTGIAAAILGSKGLHDPNAARGNLTLDRRGDLRISGIPATAKGPFTSLIVDCDGLNPQRCIVPRIRRADGAEIWGPHAVDADVPRENGLVAYTRTTADARRSVSAGENPLVVRGVGRAGVKNLCDVLLSDVDADRVVQENLISHFLNKSKVVLAVGSE